MTSYYLKLPNSYMCDQAPLCQAILLFNSFLTHWSRVTHICISKLTTIGLDSGLLPGWLQVIIWTNAGILLNWTLWTNFGGTLGKIHIFSLKKNTFENVKWEQFCLGLNVLMLIWTLCHNEHNECNLCLLPWFTNHYYWLHDLQFYSEYASKSKINFGQ